MNPLVDQYLSKAKNWRQEMEQLRIILLHCGLTEEIKWRIPCYSYQNSNVALINPLKNYCALGFFKGALLSDTESLLFQQTENMQAVRIIRITNVEQILNLRPTLETYIYEAIEVEKAGLKIEYKKNEPAEILQELQDKFDAIPDLKTAFEALTPGRQRAYLLHFSSATQAKTRISRIEKMIPRIRNGIGYNDCICGLSKKMPACDGSHKFLRAPQEE